MIASTAHATLTWLDALFIFLLCVAAIIVTGWIGGRPWNRP